jgi:hypothetical protein
MTSLSVSDRCPARGRVLLWHFCPQGRSSVHWLSRPSYRACCNNISGVLYRKKPQDLYRDVYRKYFKTGKTRKGEGIKVTDFMHINLYIYVFHLNK